MTLSNKTALVLIPTFSQTIEQRICKGIHEELADTSIRVLNAPLGYLPATDVPIDCISWIHSVLQDARPDIVLAYGGGLAFNASEQLYRQVLKCYGDIPIINIGFVLSGVPSIVVDNYHGMLELMRAVVSRRPTSGFVYISGPVQNEDSRLRLQALRDALAEHSRSDDLQEVIIGDFTSRLARELFESYLDTQTNPAETVVCSNDLTAKGVLDALRSRNYRCPEDFWVTGYDDFEYAASVQPGLSTVHFPAKDVGVQAAKLAKLLLAGDTDIPMTTEVKGYPVWRGSTGDNHPGLGDLDKELSEQWALIHQRDNNARKLTVLRSFQRRLPIATILQETRINLGDLQIESLNLFIEEVGEDGKEYLTEIGLEGNRHTRIREQTYLPTSFLETETESYWLLCPLEVEDAHYGYLVARTTLIAAEFVEFIAPQITDLLHTEALQNKNESYRLQNELNERMASLGSLVSGVAHEVNTPIGTGKLAASSLLDIVQVLRSKLADNTLTKRDFDVFVDECGEYAHIIYNSLDRAADLISNFKMVSVDQTAEAKRQFDLGEYVNSVLSSLRHQIKGTPIELHVELDEGVIVNTFPGAVAQVLTNLFMNALKHGLDNGNRAGVITFQLKKLNRGFRLTVGDSGKGASKEVLSHIYDPFFTTTRGAGGSGLGMHIVFNLISQKLNWTIQLESEPGKGFKAILGSQAQPAKEEI